MSTAILYYILGFFTGLFIILPTMLMYKRTMKYKNKIINGLLDEIEQKNKEFPCTKDSFEWSAE